MKIQELCIFSLLVVFSVVSGNSNLDYFAHFETPHSNNLHRATSPEAPSAYEPDNVMTIPELQKPSYWISSAQEFVKKRSKVQLNKNIAKNIILFIGDGMSVPTITATRIYKGQLEGRFGEQDSLYFENFPHSGLAKTYCANKQVADSACTATAYLCGVKTGYFMVGVDGSVPLNNCTASQDPSKHVQSIAQWAIKAGKSAGIVTTTRITHASPSGAFAHSANRMFESDADIAAYGIDTAKCDDIAKQLVLKEPGNKFKVIYGGGRKKFIPHDSTDEEGLKGERLDGLDLIKSWKKNNRAGRYIWNRQQLLNLNTAKTDAVLGLFNPSHLNFNLLADKTKQPSLAEMTESAIKILSKDKNGYFLFVEGGLIDHGHHLTTARLALDETLEFSEAIATALNVTNSDDTLIVVSSDHSHTMSIAGYPERGTDILGVSTNVDSNGTPYTTLSYANGPQNYLDGNCNKQDLTGKIDKTFLYPANVPLTFETHGGDDVGVFAHGPHSHLFSGVYEQHNIPHLMAYAACIGDGLKACNEAV